MFVDAQLNAYSTGVMFKANMDIATNRVFDENGTNINNPSNWPTKMFYFNYNFYISVDAIRKQVLNNLPSDVTDDSDTETLAKYSIKRFQKTENYSCYYNYWIKHEDNYESTEMGVMEFGIVRNNIVCLSAKWQDSVVEILTLSRNNRTNIRPNWTSISMFFHGPYVIKM